MFAMMFVSMIKAEDAGHFSIGSNPELDDQRQIRGMYAAEYKGYVVKHRGPKVIVDLSIEAHSELGQQSRGEENAAEKYVVQAKAKKYVVTDKEPEEKIGIGKEGRERPPFVMFHRDDDRVYEGGVMSFLLSCVSCVYHSNHYHSFSRAFVIFASRRFTSTVHFALPLRMLTAISIIYLQCSRASIIANEETYPLSPTQKVAAHPSTEAHSELDEQPHVLIWVNRMVQARENKVNWIYNVITYNALINACEKTEQAKWAMEPPTSNDQA